METNTQKIEHLQEAFSFFLSAGLTSLVSSSILISSAFATTSDLTGDASAPISSVFFGASSPGCSAAYLAASSATFLSASAYNSFCLSLYAATWSSTPSASVARLISSSLMSGTSLSWCPPTTNKELSCGSSTAILTSTAGASASAS